MNVHISNRAERNAEVEQEINQQVAKLGRRLRVFRPDLIHLHVGLEPAPSRKNGAVAISINLRLPSDQLTATSLANMGVAAVKDAFRDLTTQIDAHKELLRNRRRNFHRRRPTPIPTVPLEETVAAIKVPEPNPQATNGDIRLFVNTNMRDLERFVRRQLRLRIGAGEISANLVSLEEVLDETVANALDDHAQHPDMLSIEQWLYRLAMQAVDVVAQRNSSTGDVHIEETRKQQNVTATDEGYLQYHEDAEELFIADLIPDQTRSTPEQVVYSRETIEEVGSALACLDSTERDYFVLYALEGFSVREIAAIAQRSEDEVRKVLDSARVKLDKRLSAENPYRQILRHVDAQAA